MTTATKPIQKTVTVPLSPTDAFELFTKGIDSWWPVDSHSLSAANGDRPLKVEVEARNGGHIIETRPDGTKAEWGKITKWEPGKALEISWYVGRSEAEATTIAIAFQAVDSGTKVNLVHSGFDVLGTIAGDVHRGYFTGWDLVLGECYGSEAVRLNTLASTATT